MTSFAGPADVRGRFQKIREILHPLLILFFLLLPWFRYHGEPFVLLDIANRHFILFGFTFFSHDAPILFFVVILLLLTIFIVTAVFGRLWCGWTCPQTVFIHGLFNQIEKMILGSNVKRQLFYRSPDTPSKKLKILLLYLILLVISWVLAHSVVAYFLGSKVVTQYIAEGPAQHLSSFVTLMIMTVLLFFNFTVFREKFCFFICPYGRFQNALIDRNSIVVSYDASRGEPRGKMTSEKAIRGDCIDCNRCVLVCPTKIDIRQGFQLECIACAKCIDACNEVMEKIKRPKNLISYQTGDKRPISFRRFRLALYIGLAVIFTAGLIWMLEQRTILEINISRAHASPVSTRFADAKKITQNQIILHIKNQKNTPVHLQIDLADRSRELGFVFMSPAASINLEPGQDLKTIGFIESESSSSDPAENLIQIEFKTENEILIRSIEFLRFN